MNRGDVVVVAMAGDYGKPRPAVIIQADALPHTHESVIVCQMTSLLKEASDFRLTIEPTPENGLRRRSQIMADKPATLRRRGVGQVIGQLAPDDIARLNVMLAFVLGISD